MLSHDISYLDRNISDLHKDTYGFRPSVEFWENWETATWAEKQQTWDQIVSMLEPDDPPHIPMEEIADMIEQNPNLILDLDPER